MKNYWTKLHKKTKIGVIISCILLIFGAFFGTKLYIERPRDLGPGLEYVGTSTYGCYFMCSMPPGSEFYFATDMTEEDLKGYFKKATYVDHPGALGGSGGNYNYDFLFFQPYSDDKEFIIEYFDNTQAVIGSFDLKQTTKKYIVSIDDLHYMQARASLE